MWSGVEMNDPGVLISNNKPTAMIVTAVTKSPIEMPVKVLAEIAKVVPLVVFEVFVSWRILLELNSKKLSEFTN